MTRDQLEHAIRAACAVSSDTELYIFGSQAILGQYPDAPPSLRASVEVDLQPKNRPDAIDKIDGALGELSLFHQTHGFYVHGVSLEAATLPARWEERAIPIRNDATLGNTGYCLECHDLAASKLCASREKDREFVTTLLIEGLVVAGTLLDRIAELPVDSGVRNRLVGWVKATNLDLGLPP